MQDKHQGPYSVTGNSGEHSVSKKSNQGDWRARIATRARNYPKDKFNSLLHHLTPMLIEERLRRISPRSAPGVDGMTVDQARENLDWILPHIQEAIHKGSYKAPPVKRVYIPKADGKQRPIGVPMVCSYCTPYSALLAFLFLNPCKS